MQEVIYVKSEDLEKVNERLKSGWKVVSVTAVHGVNPVMQSDVYAYFVLESPKNYRG